MMFLRSALGGTVPRTLYPKRCATAYYSSSRGLASAAFPGLQYESTETAGLKVSNREAGGPTTTLALVAKAGPRYQPFPGISEALEHFAFKSTLKRSALRITRETELLGSEISSKRSRENIVLQAKFLSGDLPYFVELLAEVASQTKYSAHELNEIVINIVKFRQQAFLSNPEEVALDAAHSLAFHRGLGDSIVTNPATPFEQYLTAEAIAQFAKGAYAKSNIALVATGPKSADLSEWVRQFFTNLPGSVESSQFKPKEKVPSKYYGGEERISSKAGNAVVIAFPGSSAFGALGYKPEAAVLAALLGGESSIKWAPGFSLLSKATENFSRVQASTVNYGYSDAGLFTITVSGNADQVAGASKNVIETVKKVAAGDVSSEDNKKAIALAKFRALETAQTLETGLEPIGSVIINGGKPYQISEIAQGFDKVTEQQIQSFAKSFLSSKASIASVGDLFQLPFAEDLGLSA